MPAEPLRYSNAPREAEAAEPKARLRWLALGFILVSLLSLVAVPVLVERRVNALREELDAAADPARTLVIQLQLALAAEMSALRGFLITGDRPFLAEYARAASTEQLLNEQLEPLVRRIGPPVLDRFLEVQVLTARWHERTRRDDILGARDPSPDSLEYIASSQRLFDDAFRAAIGLDNSIAALTQSRRQEVRETQRSGLRVTVALVVLALLSAVGVGWLTRDIQRLVAELEQRRVQAEEALNQMAAAVAARGRLLRGVTHDVKNPLGAAYGYAELLEMGVKGPLSPEQARLATGVRTSIENALAIIGDLLDLSRTESEGLRLERAAVDLAQVVRETIEEHRGAAELARHTLAADVQSLQVHTDPARVQQVLGNLVSNALKYTPAPGTITLSTAQHDGRLGDREGVWGLIHVDDNGPGIPDEERATVFHEFYRIEGTNAQGHGLGLAISRRLARLLGGDLTVDGAPGGGARFTLWLPRRATPQDTPPPTAALR